MDVIIFLVLMSIAILSVTISIYCAIAEGITWRRDSRNPYRRYCRTCGQQQDLYTFGDAPARHGWWENMGSVNTECEIGHKIDDRIHV